ncbi:ATPase [Apiospora marii]|uniref:ATPase n=1 Tax=Apiospora marii TaxID=335849 RepID=A0ABR1SHQ8_9PEZI
MAPEQLHGKPDELDAPPNRDLNEQPSVATLYEQEAAENDEGSEHFRQEATRRHSLVQDLAREYTRNSQFVNLAGDFKQAIVDPDSELNPNGKHFNARAWSQTVAAHANSHGTRFRKTGLCFQNLNVFGYGNETDYQKDVGNVFLELPSLARGLLSPKAHRQRRIDILNRFDGILNPSEMLVVLGPPGAGCSTFLKTIAGEMNGIYVDDDAYFNYQGLTAEEIHVQHRGDAIYTAEVDVHFPMLSVGDTLTFAARARAPQSLPGEVRHAYADHYRDVVMAMYGISHTVNTRVGDQYIRGVSGGERKRVTIAEATLANAPLQCWDNSTRGLDSANAIEFCRTLKLQSELFGRSCAVSIYQAPQSAYDLFDKALVIYDGHQIFYGPANEAKEYFINLGFECPSRQTTPDFLTSMTAPSERLVRAGWESRVPRTPEDFAAAWKRSREYAALQQQIEAYKAAHPFGGDDARDFRELKQTDQHKRQRPESPYLMSYPQQVRLCLWRGWRRLTGDPWLTVFQLVANSAMSLVISSLFYNLPDTTASFYNRCAVLFVAILMNAFSSALEILTQYAQRPVVEKHVRYAFTHASTEAFSSILVDLPYKITNSIVYNLILYFMTNLNRQPGNYFFFWLTVFLMVMAMSGMFRAIASMFRTLSQAMVPAAVLILALVIFTGFVIPVDYMLGWCRWINYLDPVAYGFEALMINEYHGREFACASQVPNPAVPGYENVTLTGGQAACNAVGAVPGRATVSGDAYIGIAYKYFSAHKWRNIGILIGFALFNHIVHLAATEYISEKKSKGEVLVFRRGHNNAGSTSAFTGKKDPEASLSGPVAVVEKPNGGAQHQSDGHSSDGTAGVIQASTSVFQWQDVCYDIKIKGEPRRILDHVDGWVKPGTLTALMGVSGAGKTTLLDCLADRISMGVITGEMLVDGMQRDKSFQRKTGYVQQQDLHLETSTVREALEFSALLRQPAATPRSEKLAYVDEVIKMLDMEDYADAVVGVLGEGLNVEQRKRLTIGVELAAKPPLLLFVDEPTSGLDSQTSWAILDLLEKLSRAGQSVLCTIHQPSAMLFQRFDRLLFLAKGGKTVYFGEIGDNSETLTSYFQRQGQGSVAPCPPEANPAEWMLEVIGAAPGSATEIDWHQAWRESLEYREVQEELRRLKGDGADGRREKRRNSLATQDGRATFQEFATPLWDQLLIVTRRVFQQYWRTPSYIYSKFALCISVALFIGLVFLDAPLSIQGLQNQMFAIFNIFTIFGQLIQQQMPHFVTQRKLYEVRERPSKTYSWKVFMLSQVLTEIPWNSLASIFMWALVYYPVGLYKNAEAAGQTHERGALMWLLFWEFLVFTCTFAQACIAVADTAESGGNLAQILFMMCLLFCGVLAGPATLPGFWIFMYRVSPFTYFASAMLSTGLANTAVTCSAAELVKFDPPAGSTCGAYLEKYVSTVGGYIVDKGATSACQYCPMASTNAFLTQLSASYDHRWRDFGIGMVYIVFNIAASLFLYWLVRMPKGKKEKKSA